MNVLSTRVNGGTVLYDADLIEQPEDLTFNVKTWANRSAIIGFAEGRGTTFFVNYLDKEMVLRHYHRGGAIANVLYDQYLYLGLKHTRPWREFNLLNKLSAMRLPVPVPVAARVVRQGLLYQADIITHRIKQARNFAQIIEQDDLNQGYWVALGGLIKRFHQKGVYHADLNANNILLDEGGRFYLIDFDKGELRAVNARWQNENLERLKRSLEKIRTTIPKLNFNDTHWGWLLQGYTS